MNVQDIFDSPAIRTIERELSNLLWEYNKHCCLENGNGEKEAIRRLLDVRKQLLDKKFVMDAPYKLLLSDFNKALTEQLLKMRLAVITAYHAVRQAVPDHDIEAVGKCFLAYRYSPLHPNQSRLGKTIWEILGGTITDFVPLYEDGVISCGWRYSGGEPESENQMLYLSEQTDNWNEGLDRDMTADMHLIFPFHNLYEHTLFSIFDLLWVRDFNVEISVEYDYATYKD